MAYDYRNLGIPCKGDGRYEKKFPTTYQVIDILREHYYDLFKADISFNGGNAVYFGAPETRVYAISHTCKSFFGMKDKKQPVFTLELEKGNYPSIENHIGFRLRRELFESEINEQVLQFLKLCTYDLTGRDINFVNSVENRVKFMYIPYDQQIRYHDRLYVNHQSAYTSEYFLLFLNLYYDNISRYINYVSDDIKVRLNDFEMQWLENKISEVNDLKIFTDGEDNIEIGPKLEYVRIKKAS